MTNDLIQVISKIKKPILSIVGFDIIIIVPYIHIYEKNNHSYKKIV